MARARNIKPGFYKNEDLAECSIWARFIFPGLWMLADREGRLEDRPKRIKAELLPMDSQEVEPLLAELEGRGFIVRYEVAGQPLIWIPAFQRHQNPHHREQASELPPYQSPGLGTDGMAQKPEASASMDAKPEALPPSQGGQAVLNPSSLIPSSLIPESMPSGAEAPTADLTEAQVWEAGIQLLGRAGTSESQARAYLGRLARDYGKPALQQAVRDAMVEKPIDPLGWLNAACSRHRKASRGQATDFNPSKYKEVQDGRIPA